MSLPLNPTGVTPNTGGRSYVREYYFESSTNSSNKRTSSPGVALEDFNKILRDRRFAYREIVTGVVRKISEI